MAALLLRAKGYRILARRWRCAAGEIDLVARRGRTVAFVEVKARPTRTAALLALTAQGRRRIERAATAYQATRLRDLGLPVRFDLVSVANGLPRHHPDHWRPGS
nr:YraN family protein [Parvularcula dongshanensis]